METLLWGIILLVCGYLLGEVFNFNDFVGSFFKCVKLIGFFIIVVATFSLVTEKDSPQNNVPKTHLLATDIVGAKSFENNEDAETECLDETTEQEYNPIENTNNPVVSYDESCQQPTGHYEEIEELCVDCGGRGYNIKYIYHGGGMENGEVQTRCISCHGLGYKTKREFVMD